MRMSLQELFDIDHPTLFQEFASQPLHTAYTWACKRLKELINESLYCATPYEGEIASLRNYRHKALKHYQGNLDEIYHKHNTALPEPKLEPQLDDLINTIA